jgi:ankyrin repeat protein
LPEVDVLDSYQFTPLFYACYYGQFQSAKLLIECGADVNRIGPDYLTALLLASSGGHHEIVRLLLQHKAKIDHMDVTGKLFDHDFRPRLDYMTL